MCSLYNFGVFVYVSFSHIAYVISTSMFCIFWAISAKIIHIQYIQICYLLMCYILFTYFMIQI